MKVLMTAEQTKEYVEGWMLLKLQREYSYLPAEKVQKLAKSLARKAYRGIPGGRIYLHFEPSSRWGALKERLFPKWLKRFFPVHYREVERNQE